LAFEYVNDTPAWVQGEEPEVLFLFNRCGTQGPIEWERLRHSGANAGLVDDNGKYGIYREERRRSVRCFAYPYGQVKWEACRDVPVVVISLNFLGVAEVVYFLFYDAI
jgi:hypothetical protein